MQIKLINIELTQLREKIQKKDLLLVGKEKDIYVLMKEEKSDSIVPHLVAEVLKSLQNQPEYDTAQKLIEGKKYLDDAEK